MVTETPTATDELWVKSKVNNICSHFLKQRETKVAVAYKTQRLL